MELRDQEFETRRLAVSIIGGGLAGMSAAEALVRHFGDRIQLTVHEARRVTGGRAGSFIDTTNDETVDYCQHVAMACCTNFMQLVRRCGLQDCFRRYSELTFLHPVHPPSRFDPSARLPAPLHMARVVGAMRFLNRRQQSQVRRGMLRLLRTSDSAMRGRCAGDWLREQRQDDDTIDEFWGTFVVSALGEEIEYVDMSAVRKLMVDGFCSAQGASDVLVPEVPLSELFGKRLPQTLEKLGVDFHIGQVVGRISHTGDRVSIPVGRK
jgi:predicted NAD/FAD-binding protein